MLKNLERQEFPFTFEKLAEKIVNCDELSHSEKMLIGRALTYAIAREPGRFYIGEAYLKAVE